MLDFNYQFVENFFQSQFHFFGTPLGVIAFIIFYAIWVIFLLPGSWMTMIGGFIYGSFLGSLYVFVGAILGAIITFVISRLFLRTWLIKNIDRLPKFQLAEKIIDNEGLKIIILTRLSPLFPFGLLNVAYALSNVSLRDFIIGLLAIFPGTFLYSSLGSLASEISRFNEILSNRNDLFSFLLTLIGLLSTFLIVFLTARSASKLLQDKK
ncbi:MULTISPECIES: TVP38/TMEM64 family protein [unclassified Prochlorococcus]|uniref:TVP38/TMEM64 family protein n=1 Tax=unclassified Prochlorococcus TaxID=2627481 RepID=UPI0005337D82|nr:MULTISPECIES: VTT domain-containing protein [unclassified Prochlorococcus]KGG14541.1 putative DedA family protein [Prochlorococcus sp. MIT 0602]KGG16034.1 putative DedA family protein [Prochlorococcus sp. MIT 0603]